MGPALVKINEYVKRKGVVKREFRGHWSRLGETKLAVLSGERNINLSISYIL